MAVGMMDVGVPASRNRLLRGLSQADGQMLLPHLQSITLPRGVRLFDATAPLERVYFPEGGLFTVGAATGGRRWVEIAVVGSEGLLGWPVLLGCERSAHDATAQACDGRLTCIAVAPLLAACRVSSTLLDSLLGFIETIMVQMARTIAATVENSLEQRVARWILMRHDRLGIDQILIRHDEIAVALSARRASITDRLHVLEGERLIRCHRGRILIRDRAALEACAGGAYGASEAACRDLIGQAHIVC